MRTLLAVLVVLLPTLALADQPPPPPKWTDDKVVNELTKSCAFDPDTMDAKHRKAWTGDIEFGDSSPLTCAAAEDQSCVYDPCFDATEEKCKPRCTKDCRSCGKTCAASCETCKMDCKDFGCRRACAEKCATCHEACVRDRDHCATATCTAEYEACHAKMKSDWRANNCTKAVCGPYAACFDKCQKDHGGLEPCMKRCKPKNPGKCNVTFCKIGDFMGIDLDEDPPKDESPPAK
jgi:hypothetical protein